MHVRKTNHNANSEYALIYERRKAGGHFAGIGAAPILAALL